MQVSSTSTVDPVYYYNHLNEFVTLNPLLIVSLVCILVAYFVLFSSLGSQTAASTFATSSAMDATSNKNTTRVLSIVLGLIGIIVFYNIIVYFFSLDITAKLSDLFTETPKLDIIVDHTTASSSAASTSTVPRIKYKKQVFNIPGNHYDYKNAGAVCKAYGSRLATYSEIENAYSSGGEWCNYGWSDGQMALFPTQHSTFDELQTIEGHEHDCGRPGVNGGFIDNPNVRFGVNCYGYKPKMTSDEKELMVGSTPFPQSASDIAFQKRVDYWKTRINDILVSPFNHDTWGYL